MVIPALPGYGFSDRCLDRTFDRWWIAGLFDQLMVERLGYHRYVAHGDDIGGGIVNRLGMRHYRSVLAIQTTNWFHPYVGPRTNPLTDDERAYLAAEEEWDRTEGAYMHVQATRPQTLAYGLDDSPAGLAAWILEKFLTWTDPATRYQIPEDDLLTTVMLYWTTRTIARSVRLYAMTGAPADPADRVRVPSTVLVPHQPKLAIPPMSWLRRGYPHLVRSAVLDAGGHFLALESPDRFVAEIRETFRPYRALISGA